MIIKFLRSPAAEVQVGTPFSSVCPTGYVAAMPGHGETSSTYEANVIVAAHLTEQDFQLARLSMPAISAFEDYEDWLDYRMGSFWGLEMAGFKVELRPVELSEFMARCRLTSAAPTLSALDRFARLNKFRIIGSKRQEDEL